MNCHRTVVAPTLFLALLLPRGHAQAPSAPAGKANQGSQAAQAQDPPTAGKRRAVAKPEPLGDFVPCLLDGDQQWTMRGFANPDDPANAARKPVTGDEAKTYSEAVPNAVGESSPELADKLRSDPALKAESLVGLTRSEVLDTFTASIQKAADSMAAAPAPGARSTDKAALQTQAAEKAKSIVNPTPSTFERPADVSCSMSIMGYNETRATFGASVADNYLAIHVTVRNLNKENDFLIHDVQAAVDTGVGEDYFGRFQPGRDKLLVRAVVQRRQVTDPRNLVLNSLQVVGAIAAVPTAGMANEVATAVAIFNGQFLPGLSNIIPDPTLTYTNHVNDLTFSSSPTSKTIVPVNGAVPFVTFIPQKPIQQLPFAWCGYTRKASSGFFPFSRSLLQRCIDPTQQGSTPAYPSPYNVGKLADQHGQGSNDLLWDDLPYKKWKGAALRILQQNTFVVVGGTHIKDAGNLALNNLDCPAFPNGHVDISQTTSGMVACKITGTALGQVKSVKLEQGTSKIAGKIKPATDGDSAELTFDPSALADGDGDYSLFLVDSKGAETDSQNSVQLSKQPIVSSLDPTEIAATTAAATKTVTLKGKNLQLVTGVAFKDASGDSLTASLQAAAAADNSRTISIQTQNIKAGDYAFSYTIKEVPGKNLPSTDPQTLKVTAAAAAAAAAPAPAAKPPKPPAAHGAAGHKQ